MRALVKRVLPAPARQWIRSNRLHLRPPLYVGRLGAPWRLRPVSRNFGFERGHPVDRYYIEQFLIRWKADIHGRVLEVGEPFYTDRLASADAVVSVDVIDVDETNRRATLLLDLGAGGPVPEGARFDCIICTQTLHLVYDVRAAVHTLHDLLAPRGVLLLTVPGISQICRDEAQRWEDYWRFTGRSVARLCEGEFEAEDVTVESFGNALAASAFLYGIAVEELRRAELDHRDHDYDVVVAARAQRR